MVKLLCIFISYSCTFGLYFLKNKNTNKKTSYTKTCFVIYEYFWSYYGLNNVFMTHETNEKWLLETFTARFQWISMSFTFINHSVALLQTCLYCWTITIAWSVSRVRFWSSLVTDSKKKQWWVFGHRTATKSPLSSFSPYILYIYI